jgi:hypothetical protein
MKALFCGLLAACLPLWGAERNDVVERWNAEFLSAVRRQAPPPCLVARNLAILHLSIWRAVENAGDGNEVVAVTGAAHEACSTLFSGDRAGFDTLLGQYSDVKGVRLESARSMAREILRERENDGSNTTIHYQPALAARVWERTTNNRAPELPHWGSVKPFILQAPDQFRPPPPPPLKSESYAKDVNEVRELGGAGSGKRTSEQEQIARFWSDFSYTTSPAGRWNEIACEVLEGRSLSIREKARLLAVLNVALADAGIATWDCKYHYRFWRPVSAIRETFDDGNEATKPDKTWTSLLPSPSHPDYVSGHSTFSGAAALILSRELGVPKEKIVVTNRDMPGVTRVYGGFEQIAKEAGLSRIYGGIHFRSANEQGAELGKRVAEWTLEHFDEITANPAR